MSLLTELMQRKVFKVGAAYLVVAWLAVQAASIGFPAFDAPPWALRVFILIALLGFPLALVFAWAFDITPDGVKHEAATRGSKAVFATAAVLIALAFVWYFKGQPSYRATTNPPSQAAAGVADAPPAVALAPVVSSSPVSSKSIAVLPFTDLSPGHDQDYFSDGMAEEILNALAQVKDLKVAGRTSSFYFKGRNEDLRAIGKALGVAHILEGSVRTQGDKVRITAQLIEVADDSHLWSHAYDGDLKDVFEVQEHIARAITDQLQVVLQGNDGHRLVAVATRDPEAHALYLQASGIFNRRDGPRFPEAIDELQRAIKLDPKFARAHSRLAAIHALEPIYVPEAADASRAAAEDEAAQAIELDPRLAEPHAALSILYALQGRWMESRAAIERALAIDPDDVTANFFLGVQYINTGYTARGCEALDRVLAIDPLLPNALLWRGMQYEYAGDMARAETLLRRAADVGLLHVGVGLDGIYAAHGRTAEAIAQLTGGLRTLGAGLPPAAPAVVAAGVYGDAAAHAAALALVEQIQASQSGRLPAFVPYSLLRLGEPRRALAVLQHGLSNNSALFFHVLWSPAERATRALPEFKDLMLKIGMVDLWDRYGPPDACRRQAAGKYVCG
jgi:TolB-like protein/Tfp pilus assembly protein PilF